jgi:hypothetical protein
VDGATISYLGLLSSRVEFLEGGLARVSVVGADQAVLESEVFGLPLRLHDGGGDAWLEPVTSVGDTFLTQGCNIPGSVIPPGNYTVIAKSRDGYELQRHLGPFRALMTQPLRFDIVVHQVDKA